MLKKLVASAVETVERRMQDASSSGQADVGSVAKQLTEKRTAERQANMLRLREKASESMTQKNQKGQFKFEAPAK